MKKILFILFLMTGVLSLSASLEVIINGNPGKEFMVFVQGKGGRDIFKQTVIPASSFKNTSMNASSKLIFKPPFSVEAIIWQCTDTGKSFYLPLEISRFRLLGTFSFYINGCNGQYSYKSAGKNVQGIARPENEIGTFKFKEVEAENIPGRRIETFEMDEF